MKLHSSILANNLLNCMCLFLIQNMMLSCMAYQLLFMEDADYYKFHDNYVLYIVKCPCVIVLHICLYPECLGGMGIMKFANNHPNRFIANGSELAFLIGFGQCFTGIYCEMINCLILSFQSEIETCIVHFIALHVIMEIPNFYFESMGDNPLKKILHHPPAIDDEGRGKNIKFMDRSCFHKFARILYKCMRGFYASVFFYFIPYATFAILQFGTGYFVSGLNKDK